MGGVQNVLETFEMAIEHKRRTARTEIRVFSVAGFFKNNNNNNNNKQIGVAPQGRNFRGAEGTYVQKYFYGPLTGRRSPDSLLWHRH